MPSASLKPTPKAIQDYYATLRDYHEHRVSHEGALSTAFQTLLAETCKAYHRRLVPLGPINFGVKRLRRFFLSLPTDEVSLA